MSLARRVLLALALLAVAVPPARGAGDRPGSQTRTVILVTLDGLRPEEVFAGAEESLLTKKPGGVSEPAATRAAFWRDTPEARREALMPFLWRVVARQGQIFGNAGKGSVARVTNGRNFSYPGYNEILTGSPDDRIDSNAKKPNPNVNVLEWLNSKPAYRDKVAAFTSWDVFPFILNRDRSGLLVTAAFEPIKPLGDDDALSERQMLLNDLNRHTPRIWHDVCYDAFTAEAACEHLRKHSPRVLYVSLGETDEFAHEGRYDRYLEAAHRGDFYLERLWRLSQAQVDKRGPTTLIVTTDHGRGGLPDGWKNHGANVPGADKIWVAILGPDTPALGERSNLETITQGQVAATLAALLGEDYRADFPKAAPPIEDALRPHKP